MEKERTVIAFQLVECARKGDVNKCKAILESNAWKAKDVKDETGFKIGNLTHGRTYTFALGGL